MATGSTPSGRGEPASELREAMTSRLFLRIYATFVGTVLGFALLVGVLVWAAISSWSEDRIAELITPLEAVGEPLAAAVQAGDEAAVAAILAELDGQVAANLRVFPRVRGRRFGPAFGDPPSAEGRPRSPAPEGPLTRSELARVRQGLPLIRRSGLGPPTIALALFEGGFARASEDEPGEPDEVDERPGARAERGRMIAVVVVEPQHNPRVAVLVGGTLLLLALAGGAWPLARSLTSRLAKLERSTRALAGGELSHRAELSQIQPRDEVDRLALSFNLMAERLETLVTGQRTLLANVSHELRTPIARAKVLVELLGERVEQLREAEREGLSPDARDLARLERGFHELEDDLREVESLIQDLLTSGRLELGRTQALDFEPIVLADLCQAAAARFDASVECPPELRVAGDRMLLDRLLRNLLTNARRACPEGAVWIRAERDGDAIVIAVEDEGPGVPANKRSYIFEPFARLDAARARDAGGVGLGLYLCRQIATAHDGTLTIEDRRDGRAGARFVTRLPVRA
jgi:signal transduction histidine kinase